MLTFMAVVYLLTLYVRPAEIVPAWAEFPFAQVVAVAAAIVAVVTLLISPRPLLNRSEDHFVLAFWAAIAVSNAAWGWFGGAWLGVSDFAPTAFAYFLIRATVTSHAKFRILVFTLVSLSLALAANGIVQYHSGVGFGGVTTIQDGRIRGTGIFNDPNDLGLALVVVAPFLVSRILERTRFSIRLVAVVALAPILLAIYYTNSRGAVIGLAAAMVAYASTRFRTMASPLVGTLLVIGLMAAAPSRAAELDSAEESAQSRIQAWSAGIVMLKINPLFGVGYGRFTEFHERVAHNSFVHTFSELGLLGAFCFTGMWFAYFVGLRKHRNGADQGEASVATERDRRALMASGVGLLACAAFLSRQYVVVPYVVLALGTSYAAVTGPNGPHSGVVARLVGTLGLTVAGVIFTRLAVMFLAVW